MLITIREIYEKTLIIFNSYYSLIAHFSNISMKLKKLYIYIIIIFHTVND